MGSLGIIPLQIPENQLMFTITRAIQDIIYPQRNKYLQYGDLIKLFIQSRGSLDPYSSEVQAESINNELCIYCLCKL